MVVIDRFHCSSHCNPLVWTPTRAMFYDKIYLIWFSFPSNIFTNLYYKHFLWFIILPRVCIIIPDLIFFPVFVIYPRLCNKYLLQFSAPSLQTFPEYVKLYPIQFSGMKTKLAAILPTLGMDTNLWRKIRLGMISHTRVYNRGLGEYLQTRGIFINSVEKYIRHNFTYSGNIANSRKYLQIRGKIRL